MPQLKIITKTKKAQIVKRHLKSAMHLANMFKFEKVVLHNEAISLIHNNKFLEYKDFCIMNDILYYDWD